ncbi:recombinase family protein [uncultured Trichococcus sp.]|uniref:recombinase family protein n=1 Tax=uncultured Trichococcus sp. TaxID=189665 RepID=UPI002A187399|nr:recombinase family protein [uncultured Trichococcus sp.]
MIKPIDVAAEIKAALYIRVSSQEQAEEGYSIGAQTERLTAYCKAKGWTVYRTYTDGGFTGSNTDRPALEKLISDVKNKLVDIVLVYKLDRLSRSQKDTLYLIEDVFLQYGVGFVSMNENFDTSTPFGRAMIGILSVFAQLEREQIMERMSMGRSERAKAGLYHGGGEIPIGYDYTDGALVVNEYEAMQIREMYSMFLDGCSYHEIRKYLSERYTTKSGSWTSTSSVSRSLKQVLYIGKIEHKGAIHEGQHEPIISPEVFAAAQAQINEIRSRPLSRSLQASRKKPQYLLTGMLYCGQCGARYFSHQSTYVYKDKREPRHWYKCYSRHGSPYYMVKDPGCKNKNYRLETLDQMILDEIKKLKYDASYLTRLTTKPEPDNKIPILQNRIAEIEKQISRIMDLYQLGNSAFDQVKDRIQTLADEKDKLIQEIEGDEKQKRPLSVDETVSLLDGALEVIANGALDEKRVLVTSLINKIVIDGEDITIHWAFV